jgi:prephenate dehydrogenase
VTIAVVGPGLIGRSIALAARRSQRDLGVIEIDRGESLAPAAAVDIVILATPVDVILDTLRHNPGLLRNTLTIDTGSTKRAIVTAARHAGLDRFVGGHPMAGAATSGPSGARDDLFDGRPWFLVPHGASETATDLAISFVRRLGATPVVMNDDGSEHDRVMAAVSQLPQVVASVLMNVAGKAAGDRLGWAGPGLRDTTRLADSNATMWQSLLQTNASELRPLLHAMAEQLRMVADHLDSDRTIDELFVTANRYRALL